MTRPTRLSTGLACLLCLALALPAAAATSESDDAGIRAAVEDYVDSVYRVEPERVEQSMHPKLQKVGYFKPDGSDEYREAWMNFYEFVDLAATYNQNGRIDLKTAPRKIQILDRLDTTAVARLDAAWGIDFFHLAKKDDRWIVMNVIWQSEPPPSFAEQSDAEAKADVEGIRQAALDYANSAYQVAPELIERSVHPHVQKVGYVRPREGDGYREAWMNFTELQQLVEAWNVDNRQFDPATAKAEVHVLDRLDQIAMARLDAEWGVDYFHLAKKDGRWIIMNVIWQVYPKAEPPAP